MSLHLIRELERIKKSMLKMATLVEETIEKATRSVIERNVQLAQEVMDGDSVIDQLEIDIEEECLKTLALHQPVAVDLRYLISVLKINPDLERMADLSVNIARTTPFLTQADNVEMGFNFGELSGMVREMVGDSLNALLERDPRLARRVIEKDDKVDKVKTTAGNWAIEGIKENPEQAGIYLRYLSCVRNLERIGDLATNIAEDVIYLVEGKIVRHQMGGD